MTSNGDKLHDELVMLRNKVAKYESDHPWAKALQEVANEAVEELSLQTKALKVAREALMRIATLGYGLHQGNGDGDFRAIARQELKTIDEVLGKGEV